MYESKAISSKAVAFKFAVALQSWCEAQGKKAEIIQDKNYYEAISEYFMISMDRANSLGKILDKVVSEFTSIEPILLDKSSGKIKLRVLPLRISKRRKTGRELEVISDKGGDLGFSFSKDIQPILRLSLLDDKGAVDFGKDLLGNACSFKYLEKVNEIAKPLYENEGRSWEDLFPDSNEKFQKIYVPLLQCFSKELFRLCEEFGCAGNFVKAFFGDKDYYQVLLPEKKTVRIFGFKPNEGSGMHFPTQLRMANFKEKRNGKFSYTTLNLVFNNGWVMNLKLHPANVKILPSSFRFEADFKESRPYGMFIQEIR